MEMLENWSFWIFFGGFAVFGACWIFFGVLSAVINELATRPQAPESNHERIAASVRQRYSTWSTDIR